MNNSPIIFLDCDGVLNRFPPKEGDRKSWPPMSRVEKVTAESLGWLPEPVSIIQDFVNNFGCSLVITSTWRHHMLPGQFEEGLGTPFGSVIGITKSLVDGRGAEIIQWRKGFDHRGPFAIIDDDVLDIDCHPSLKQHIVKTQTHIGLTTELVCKIDEALST